MLNNRYRKEIQNLDLIISNWSTLAESDTRYVKLGKLDIDTHQGLCHNAVLYFLPDSVRNKAFESWVNFSGSHLYPIEGNGFDFMANGNKFTVERLRLAKHIRTELFIKGTPKPSLSVKFDNALDNKILSFTLVFLMFWLVGHFMLRLI